MNREIDIPYYPKTQHLPYRPNVLDDDLIASSNEADGLLNNQTLIIEEKIDGANCGAIWDGSDFMVRNREHILRKGYQKKETSAKLQFRPLWTWLYEHRDCFEKLNNLVGEPVSVYGEWLWALHSVTYDCLPAHFIPLHYIFPDGNETTQSPNGKREFLEQSGFTNPPILHSGPIQSFNELDPLLESQSAWGSDKIEGLVLKASNLRFKILRPGYTRNVKWDNLKITRQKLAK